MNTSWKTFKLWFKITKPKWNKKKTNLLQTSLRKQKKKKKRKSTQISKHVLCTIYWKALYHLFYFIQQTSFVLFCILGHILQIYIIKGTIIEQNQSIMLHKFCQEKQYCVQIIPHNLKSKKLRTWLLDYFFPIKSQEFFSYN